MWFPKLGAGCAFVLLVATAAPSRADEAEDARAVYALGKAAYDRGEYQEALTHFTRAYALRPAPALLFNMAQASRLSGKGHCAEALDLYERYLERDPAPENRTEVEERIVQMRACASAAKPVAPLTPAPGPTVPLPVAPANALRPDSESPPAHHSPPLAAVLATGIGASMALAGGVLYLRARSKFGEAQAACPCPEGTYSDWETLTTVSYALMATGVVVSGTGATFWILSGMSESADTKVSGGGLRFSGRF
jgi:tetratricopeptide (TPR) repeat protein